MEGEGLMRCFVADVRDENEMCDKPYILFSNLYHLDKEACLFIASLEEPLPNQDLHVCSYHAKYRKRQARRKYCCDPFHNHTLKIRKECEVSAKLAKVLWSHKLYVNPGQGLCRKCYTVANGLATSMESGDPPSAQACSLQKQDERPSCSQTRHDNVALGEDPERESFRTPSCSQDQKPHDKLRGVEQSPDLFSSEEEKNIEGSSCIVGFFYKDACTGAQEIANEEEQEILRTVFENVPSNAILCSGHARRLRVKLEQTQKHCVNPLQQHGQRKKYVSASFALVKAYRSEGVSINVLDGLCKDCFAKGNKFLADASKIAGEQSDRDDSQSVEPSQSTSSLSGVLGSERAQIDANNILKASGLEPLKPMNYHITDKIKYATMKTQELCDKFESLVCKALDVARPDIKPSTVEVRAREYDQLLNDLQMKMQDATYSEKLTIMTLIPDSYGVQEVIKKFNVSKYMVKKARRMKRAKGILSKPEKKIGRPISVEILQRVEEFYNNTDFSRECPGMKQQVSMGKGIYKSKRLLLGNLSELYIAFKENHPDLKIGRSLFRSLRPKYCVLPGSAGTHSVCVCKYHENMKLLLEAIDASFTYQDVVEKVVCDSNNRDCMLRLCEKCPRKNEVLETVTGLISKALNTDEISSNDSASEAESEAETQIDEVSIKYKQWSSTDRPDKESSMPEFIKVFLNQLLELIPHSFIAKQQSVHLKNCKENLTEEAVIVLMDLAENYNYVIQEEVQSHYFSRGSCSIHPAVLYYKSNRELQSQSLCFVSDDTRHDVAFVDAVQIGVVKFIKETLPRVGRLHYFTDGCAAQYKNCTSFLNLCKHKEKYDLEATWSFFATSHGKSPCDGIGGAVKRAARTESLQRVKSSQNPINNVQEFFNFCKLREKSGSTVQHFLLTREEINASRNLLSNLDPKTVTGTRSFHSFTPITTSIIGCKRLGTDTTYALVFDLSEALTPPQFQEGSFVCCVVEDKWQLALINHLNYEESEAEVTVCTPLPQKKSYDYCDASVRIVMFSEVLCEADVDIKRTKIVLKTHVRAIAKALKRFKKKRTDLLML